MITQERLKERIYYDPDTGGLFFKNKARMKLIDTYDGDGYIRPRVDDRQYPAHRLAFLYMTGEMPKDGVHVDHINHIKDDNRWCNLRLVTQKENRRNMKLNISNKSGICGVYWNKQRNKWQSQIMTDEKFTCLGRFYSLLDACCARKSAEIKYNYHPNHGKR